MQTDTLPVGAVIGKCEVRGMLGRGGMGAVYRAWHPNLHIEVAIKVISVAPGASREALRERFRREARASAQIRHDGVVRVFDVDAQDGLDYMVMELIDGDSVRALIRRGTVDTRTAARIVRDAADALEAAHQRGIIHRDIKPENLLLTRKGRVKVTDFGLARLIGDDSGLTRSGQVLGTPYYMAPEQINGLKLDGRADIYALGATLYHLVTGSVPYDGDSAIQVCMQHLTQPLPSVREKRPDCPPALEATIHRMLNKEAADRFADCAELRAALAPFAEGEPPWKAEVVGAGLDQLAQGLTSGVGTVTPDASTAMPVRAGGSDVTADVIPPPFESNAVEDGLDQGAGGGGFGWLGIAAGVLAVLGVVLLVIAPWRNNPQSGPGTLSSPETVQGDVVAILPAQTPSPTPPAVSEEQLDGSPVATSKARPVAPTQSDALPDQGPVVIAGLPEPPPGDPPLLGEAASPGESGEPAEGAPAAAASSPQADARVQQRLQNLLTRGIKAGAEERYDEAFDLYRAVIEATRKGDSMAESALAQSALLQSATLAEQIGRFKQALADYDRLVGEYGEGALVLGMQDTITERRTALVQLVARSEVELAPTTYQLERRGRRLCITDANLDGLADIVLTGRDPRVMISRGRSMAWFDLP
ncbi:MAG: protein kinase domain-containing protein, partial [Planctomycetota bacterium]